MISSDYKDMLLALSAENVKFMLVGGYALAAHGHPRFTMDIDLFVMASPENASAVIRALKRFGAPLMGVSAADFEKEGDVFQIGVAPMRIDIITRIAGVSFADAYPRAVVTEWEGIRVHVLSLQDLLANKRASGRIKDLADVQLLERLLAGQ
jgi:predicted nucleotidyltransferase